eukprot:6232608-Prymnesium_polylepis.1
MSLPNESHPGSSYNRIVPGNSPPMAAAVDRSIGQYRLGLVIGQGSFGTVYLGTHLRTGEHAA